MLAFYLLIANKNAISSNDWFTDWIGTSSKITTTFTSAISTVERTAPPDAPNGWYAWAGTSSKITTTFTSAISTVERTAPPDAPNGWYAWEGTSSKASTTFTNAIDIN